MNYPQFKPRKQVVEDKAPKGKREYMYCSICHCIQTVVDVQIKGRYEYYYMRCGHTRHFTTR